MASSGFALTITPQGGVALAILEPGAFGTFIYNGSAWQRKNIYGDEILIGYGAEVIGSYGIAIGYDATANGGSALAVGRQTDTGGFAESSAFGYLAINTAANQMALGGTGLTEILTSASLKMGEKAAAESDVAGFGQVWIKSDTPNTLWFTDDAGTDTQLGLGGGGAEVNVESLAGDVELVPGTAKQAQYLNPNGANRTITLDTDSVSEGDIFYIENTMTPASTSYYLEILPQAGTYITRLYPSAFGKFIYNGSAWEDYETVLVDITMGYNAYSLGIDGVVIGENAYAGASNCVIIGSSARNGRTNAVSIGYGAGSAYGNGSVSVGAGASGYFNFDTAVGNNANTDSGGNSVAIGRESNGGDGANSVAVGAYASAEKGRCVTIGYQSKGGDTGGTAVGYYADAEATYAVAMGYYSLGGATEGVAIGRSADAETAYSTVLGSYNHGGLGYGLVIGSHSHAERFGEQWTGADVELTANKAGRGQITWNGSTADATPTEMFIRGVASNRFTIIANSAINFTIKVIARDSTSGDIASYNFYGAIKRDGSSNTALVGSLVKDIIAEEDTSWDCAVTADDTNEALIVTVTGDASNTVKWSATVYYTEIRI